MCIFMHNTKLHFIGITAEGKNCQTYVKNAMYGYISTFCYLLTSEYSNHIYFCNCQAHHILWHRLCATVSIPRLTNVSVTPHTDSPKAWQHERPLWPYSCEYCQF